MNNTTSNESNRQYLAAIAPFAAVELLKSELGPAGIHNIYQDSLLSDPKIYDRSLASKVLKKIKNIDIKDTLDPLYAASAKSIYGPDKVYLGSITRGVPEVAAHEIGHIIDQRKNKLLNSGMLRDIGRYSPSLSAAAASLALLSDAESEDKKKYLNYAAIGGGLASIPTLRSELAASKYGNDLIKSISKSRPTFKPYSNQILNYILATTVPAVAIPLLAKFLVKDKDMNKESYLKIAEDTREDLLIKLRDKVREEGSLFDRLRYYNEINKDPLVFKSKDEWLDHIGTSEEDLDKRQLQDTIIDATKSDTSMIPTVDEPINPFQEPVIKGANMNKISLLDLAVAFTKVSGYTEDINDMDRVLANTVQDTPEEIKQKLIPTLNTFFGKQTRDPIGQSTQIKTPQYINNNSLSDFFWKPFKKS